MPHSEIASPFGRPRPTVALVLSGGCGRRLTDLIDRRAKPTVHFGRKFRTIDFALSNCLNSGIRRIGVLTRCRTPAASTAASRA